MYYWCLLTRIPARRLTFRALGITTLVACTTLGACGGDSKSERAPATDETDGAAASGNSQADGAASVSSETRTDAASAIVTSETETDAASTSESSSGADSGCRDLCSDTAPACCTPELSCVERVPRCRIDVLADHLDTTYDYADLEAKAGTWPGAVEFAIPLDAVERATAEPPPAARFELTLDAEASTTLAQLSVVYSQPFRLSCDEQELFVGVVYMAEGAAALRTPVLHVKQAEDGALVLRLGAWQSAWALNGNGGTTELRERLDRSELRAQLCERGILEELR